MERLWAPWRMRYIEGLAQPSDCFLCDYPRLPVEKDPETLILARGEKAFVILNLFPYNCGHMVVAPYEHQGIYEEVPAETHAEMAALTSRAIAALRAEYDPQGFNIGMNLGRVAGAGVPDHLHEHVVPRWGGDANFMTTVGETKTLPESLDQTYARLRPHLAG
ncbi:MAG: HIT family protein [Actinomycetota bacterium]